MSARENILNRLKSAVSGADVAKLPQAPKYPLGKLAPEQMFEHFVGLLKANQAKVIETDKTQLSTVVAHEMAQLGMTTLLYGKNTPFSGQIEAIQGNVELTAFDFELDKAGKDILFDKIEVGITTSLCAIAALGAIVLWPDENEPRTLSLVPEAHFVIVERAQLFADFPSVIAEQQWQNNMPTNVVLLSGPSKTGDVQQHMAFGAHGPRHLIVLLV